LILDLLYIYLKKRKRGNLRKGDLGNKKPAIDSTSWYYKQSFARSDPRYSDNQKEDDKNGIGGGRYRDFSRF